MIVLGTEKEDTLSGDYIADALFTYMKHKVIALNHLHF